MLALLNKMPRALRKKLFVIWALTTRSMTLGVRGIVFNKNAEVLLVRHTYVEGWHLPGGGVERGETMRDAMQKELREEANVQVLGEPRLFAIYRNILTSRFDHVAVFVIEDWSGEGAREANFEIAETGFFPLSDLPAETTDPTVARLLEYSNAQPVRDHW